MCWQFVGEVYFITANKYQNKFLINLKLNNINVLKTFALKMFFSPSPLLPQEKDTHCTQFFPPLTFFQNTPVSSTVPTYIHVTFVICFSWRLVTIKTAFKNQNVVHLLTLQFKHLQWIILDATWFECRLFFFWFCF